MKLNLRLDKQFLFFRNLCTLEYFIFYGTTKVAQEKTISPVAHGESNAFNFLFHFFPRRIRFFARDIEDEPRTINRRDAYL